MPIYCQRLEDSRVLVSAALRWRPAAKKEELTAFVVSLVWLRPRPALIWQWERQGVA